MDPGSKGERKTITMSTYRPHEEKSTSGIGVGLYLFGMANKAYNKGNTPSQTQDDDTTSLSESITYIKQHKRRKILNHQTAQCTVTG